MRHGKTHNHLGRTNTHRKALLKNMAISLIMHKRIETTTAKAKELRKYVEPLINRSKQDDTHNRRTVFSYLQDKEAIKELFGVVAEKVAGRPGGYTRIIKLGNRLGDNADMCLIELVDFNELLLNAGEAKEKKTRRGRRSGKKADAPAAEAESEAPEAPAAEEKTEE
jgi:large subunit ribosomal protein L17